MLDVLFFTSRKGSVPYFDLAVRNIKELKTKNIEHKDISKWRYKGFLVIPFMDLWSVAKYKIIEKKSTEENFFLKNRWQLILPFKWLELILRFLNYYAAFEKDQSICLAVWNGFKDRPAVAKLVAESLNRKVIYFEIGVMANTTVLDEKGITAESSIPKDLIFYKEKRFDLKYGEIPKRNIEVRPTNANKDRSVLKKISLPEKYIFIPFQQVDDSSILVHSKLIRTMYALYNWIEFVASKTSKDMFFVFKEHPSDSRDYKELYEKDKTGRILFANGNDTRALIEGAEAIITINSMVGMEALILHKKVITLGDSWFSFDGITKQAKNKEELLKEVLCVDNWKIDLQVIESYLSYVYYEYSLPESYHSTSNRHWLAVEDKIKKIINVRD